RVGRAARSGGDAREGDGQVCGAGGGGLAAPELEVLVQVEGGSVGGGRRAAASGEEKTAHEDRGRPETTSAHAPMVADAAGVRRPFRLRRGRPQRRSALHVPVMPPAPARLPSRRVPAIVAE